VFDHVDYTILFRKLVTREVSAYILRLLWNWYGHHYAIQWACIIACNFNICNGVRQGGILSVFLFAVYIDELSLCLHSVNIGCRLSNMIVNHLLFADDAVVFASSAKGLQQLLDTCSKFAESHSLGCFCRAMHVLL